MDSVDRQHEHWETIYSEEPTLYGEKPSFAAQTAAQQFKLQGVEEIVELGCGHGRDTIFFAQSGLKVFALDYSKTAIDTLTRRVEALGLSKLVFPKSHDVRRPLPFGRETMGGIYSHMLYSMAFTPTQLQSLSREALRILKSNGLNIFTVRTKQDSHFGKGIQRGDDVYENDGFIVRFFDVENLQSLTEGSEIIKVEQFQEGELPRKLFLVTLRKQR